MFKLSNSSLSLLPFLYPLPIAHTTIRTLKQIPTTTRSTKTVPKKILPRHAGPPVRKRPLQPPRSSQADLTPSLPQDPSSATPSSQSVPYHVARTKSKKLPVYLEAKAGGSLKLTKIRKVEGDLNTLKQDLERFLASLEEARGKTPDVNVNWLTGHVVVKGQRKPVIEDFLLSKNF